MNARRLLPISLVLNLCLLVAAGWLAIREPTRTASSARPQPQPAPTASAPAPVPAPLQAQPAKPVQSFDWRLVESEDYKKYIANLRSIGCPEETIRDIISADVKKLFDARKRTLNASTNKFEYWKAGNLFGSMMNEEKIKQSQELAKEKRDLLKELLGVAPEEKPDMFGGMNPFESMLDFLPADKQNQVAEVFQKFQAKMVKGFSGGSPDAEDMKKIQGMQKEMETELGKILSPDELESYQLRMSQTAMMMRMQLASFDPSEQEFRDIFKLKKSFDDQFGSFGMLSQDKTEKQKYNDAKKDLDGQVKSLLGDSRYQDYERAQDYAYQGIYRVADRNGLGKEAANQVYDMKKAAEEQATRLRGDTTLSPEQRTEALKGIRTETENSIRTVFGDKGWQSYQSQPGAYWLKNISPDPKSD
ncbi:MAG TPA: hypothetical protein VN794_04780 [Methylomirabilota bacterium]|nr:hypothetical protein [Methylomirabilota bacterium]